jgi:CRISPR system Cascade subunit CasA
LVLMRQFFAQGRAFAMLKYSVLTESLFVVASGQNASESLSLPQVLARLSAAEALVFTDLRPHQRPAWHAFLVQLAFLALRHEAEPSAPTNPHSWLQLLRKMTATQGGDAAWCLVNGDWQSPAFMQPPCSPEHRADFKHGTDSAQAFDVLVTARHHDEKAGKLLLSQVGKDCLVYALVTLQGGSPFMGRGNYNSMRMNGGFSSRPQFRLVFEPRGSGAEFLRDLRILLANRQVLKQEARLLGMGTAPGDGHALLWLLPWDTGSLPLSDVHPLCLEVCRRVRLTEDAEQLTLLRATSDAARVNAKDQHGHVLDPWVPILRDGSTRALTAQSTSFGYRSLQGLLLDSQRVHWPLLAQATEGECRAGRGATLVAQVLVSGDGRTDGLLLREVPIPAAVLALLAGDATVLAQRSQRFVSMASACAMALRTALLQYVDGGELLDWRNRVFVKTTEAWSERFDAAIDGVFFATLFGTVESDLTDAAAQALWRAWLEDTAAQLLAQAIEVLPTRERSHLFAQDRAHTTLATGLAKHLTAQRSGATPQETVHE